MKNQKAKKAGFAVYLSSNSFNDLFRFIRAASGMDGVWHLQFRFAGKTISMQ